MVVDVTSSQIVLYETLEHCPVCDKSEVLPGFEPGSLDSESRVLTITP